MFSATFIQIYSKNVQIEENHKADENRSPTTGLSGKVLKVEIAMCLRVASANQLTRIASLLILRIPVNII